VKGRAAPSRKLLRSAALFGLTLDRAGAPAARPARWAPVLAARLDAALKPRGVALVTGPSGAGKSTLLAALARQLGGGGAGRRRGGNVVLASTAPLSPAQRRRAVVDLLDLPLQETLHTLSAAGLAEARLLGQPAGALSDGQRFRLALAMALARAGRGTGRGVTTLIVDEFGSTLDRTTARGVACTLARWVRRSPNLRAVFATSHEDVEAWLEPEIVVRTRLGEAGRASIERRPRAAAGSTR
jgi:ABC-type ATPase with predicted acetyltransferase domain